MPKWIPVTSQPPEPRSTEFFDALAGWKKFIGDGQNVTKRNGKVPGASCAACGVVVISGLKLKRPEAKAAPAKS